MSRNYPAGQYEHDYSPARLCNWEVPRKDKPTLNGVTQTGTLAARQGRTEFVVDERGYLLSGVPKKNAAFVYDAAAGGRRWPEANPAIKQAPAATMGYKGIPTEYLPRNTTIIKTVEMPGCKETSFR